MTSLQDQIYVVTPDSLAAFAGLIEGTPGSVRLLKGQVCGFYDALSRVLMRVLTHYLTRF